ANPAATDPMNWRRFTLMCTPLVHSLKTLGATAKRDGPVRGILAALHLLALGISAPSGPSVEPRWAPRGWPEASGRLLRIEAWREITEPLMFEGRSQHGSFSYHRT